MIPFLIAGAAILGIGAHAVASADNSEARSKNTQANNIINESTRLAQNAKQQCQASIDVLAEIKAVILKGTMKRFVKSFSKIKSVNFNDTGDLFDAANFNKNEITVMQTMVNSVNKVSVNDVVGGVSGTALAIGATDILTGGSILGGAGLSVGSLTGGAALGAIAAPIFAVTGIFSASEAAANLEKANSNLAKAIAYQDECLTYSYFAESVQQRCDLFSSTLNMVNANWFNDAVDELERLVSSKKTVGYFFRNMFGKRIYSREEMRTVASVAALAKMVKTIIDTNILDDNGNVAENSEIVINQIIEQLEDQEKICLVDGSECLKSDLDISDFLIDFNGEQWNFVNRFTGEKAWYTFVENDNFYTYRNIKFPNDLNNVMNVYGETQIYPYQGKCDVLYIIGILEDSDDIKHLDTATKFIWYRTILQGEKASILFYFDDQDKLLLVGYLLGEWNVLNI